jgi:hypothetical protein
MVCYRNVTGIPADKWVKVTQTNLGLFTVLLHVNVKKSVFRTTADNGLWRYSDQKKRKLYE